MNDNYLRHFQQLVWTQEILTNFQCLSCLGGWSIRDYDQQMAQRVFKSRHLHCPWCGIAQRTPASLGDGDTDD